MLIIVLWCGDIEAIEAEVMVTSSRIEVEVEGAVGRVEGLVSFVIDLHETNKNSNYKLLLHWKLQFNEAQACCSMQITNFKERSRSTHHSTNK